MPVLDGFNKICEEEMAVTAGSGKASTQELSNEVDVLVSRISQTLQLESQQKLRIRRVKDVRKAAHPYGVATKFVNREDEIGRRRSSPEKGSSDCEKESYCKSLKAKCRRSVQYKPEYPTDPHELLKYLLCEGSLINEAVQRLKGRHKHSSKVSTIEETELRVR